MQYTLRKCPHLELPKEIGLSLSHIPSGGLNLFNIQRTNYFFPNLIRLSIVENISQFRPDEVECMFVENICPDFTKLDYDIFKREQANPSYIRVAHFLNGEQNDPFHVAKTDIIEFVRSLEDLKIWATPENHPYFFITEQIKNNELANFSLLKEALKKEDIDTRKYIKSYILEYALQENYQYIGQLCSHSLFKNSYKKHKIDMLKPVIFAGQKEILYNLLNHNILDTNELHGLINKFQNTTAMFVPEFKTTLDMLDLEFSLNKPELTPTTEINQLKKRTKKI